MATQEDIMPQAKQPDPGSKSTPTEDIKEVTMKDVKSDIGELRQDVDALFANLATLAQQTAHDGVERTHNAADATSKAVVDAEEEMRSYISRNPLMACGAALGVGFIGALLLRR